MPTPKISNAVPRLLIACDKFKGSLRSSELNACLSDALKKTFPQIDIQCLAVSDGGDGLLEAMQSIVPFTQHAISVRDPLGRKATANIGIDYSSPQHQRVIIAAHEANGLHLLDTNERNPMLASSAGVGDLLLASHTRLADEICLGLGGSATCDGGIGALAVLGFRFIDQLGNEVPPLASQLSQIKEIIAPAQALHFKLTLLADVSNPAIGPRGAARVFSPQKGANSAQVEQLEHGMRHWVGVLEKHTGRELGQMPGAGAAGGLALGLHALLGAQIVSGADWFLTQAQMADRLSQVDWLITGEGRFDLSSLEGKITGQLLQYASRAQIKRLLIVGQIEAGLDSPADRTVVLNQTSEKRAYSSKVTRQQLQNWAEVLPEDFWVKV